MIKPETVSGVRTYQFNLVLDIVFGVFALIIGLTAILVASTDRASTFATGAILGAAGCGLLSVFVINFIVSLMSVFKMHHGAQEYGPEHARNARLGVVFKWTETALSTLAAVLVVYLFLAGISTLVVAPGQRSVPVAIFVPLLVTAF